MFKKIFSIFAALTLSVGLWAIDNVKYIDAAGVEQTANGVTEITNASTTLSGGWYVVYGADVQTGTLICQGDVHLILCDGAKLTATGAESNAGIQVSGAENSLAIYGQINQSGQLIAEGGDLAAGIGGGAMASGSNITINGGTVTANGKLCAAGIGGGTIGSGSNITINRGTVKAKGGDYGAGIGGGNMGDGSNIIINGGTVEATGGSEGAGIGGGCDGSGSNITINGGTVKAISTYAAAGIGGGNKGDGSNITINGGTVTAECRNANTPGDAIGSGASASTPASNIFVTTSLVIKAGDTENPTTEIAVERTSTTDIAADLVGKQYATIESPAGPTPVSTTYLDENGEEQNIDAFEVKDASEAVTWGTAGETTWFVVNGTNVQLAKGAICAGDVRLILADGAKLTATGWFDETDWIGYAGIQVSGDGNSLTIYAQSTGTQMGQLIATGQVLAAGIGGGYGESGSNITILAGTVTATGGDNAAGIGGGYAGYGSNITINGGEVTAIGGYEAAGIGGGESGFGSNITINGGEVEATGGEEGAGIGGGMSEIGSNITINGGIVTATGGEYAAGIGGGSYGDGSNITINGGEVTATGKGDAAGIGGGTFASGSNIFVATSLQVKADGNNPPTTVITNTGADLASSLAGKRYATIELAPFTLPDKTAGQYATICLPRPIASVTNGTLYKISYGNIYEVHFVEETNFTADPAGTPYLVQAEADGDIVFTMADADPVTAPVGVETANGFVASLQEGLQDMPEGYNYLLVSGGELHSAGPGCQLSKNHAYINVNYVPASAPEPQGAPRRVVLYNAERQMPTGLYQTQDTKHGIQKLLRNGQMLIIRENKVYNAQGQIVK